MRRLRIWWQWHRTTTWLRNHAEKTVGELCAGKSHAQFEGRVLETEQRCSVHCGSQVGALKWQLNDLVGTQPKRRATAPALDPSRQPRPSTYARDRVFRPVIRIQPGRVGVSVLLPWSRIACVSRLNWRRSARPECRGGRRLKCVGRIASGPVWCLLRPAPSPASLVIRAADRFFGFAAPC